MMHEKAGYGELAECFPNYEEQIAKDRETDARYR